MIDHHESGDENPVRKFSGNPLFCWPTLFSLFVAGLMISTLFDSGKAQWQRNLPLVTVAMLFMSLLAGFQLFYFEVSSSHLIVKNHILLWITREYRLDEIDSVFIKTYGRSSDALCLSIKNSRRKKIFHAGSLREKDWTALEKTLKHIGLWAPDKPVGSHH